MPAHKLQGWKIVRCAIDKIRSYTSLHGCSSAVHCIECRGGDVLAVPSFVTSCQAHKVPGPTDNALQVSPFLRNRTAGNNAIM
jgi:hypothetical protein